MFPFNTVTSLSHLGCNCHPHNTEPLAHPPLSCISHRSILSHSVSTPHNCSPQTLPSLPESMIYSAPLSIPSHVASGHSSATIATSQQPTTPFTLPDLSPMMLFPPTPDSMSDVPRWPVSIAQSPEGSSEDLDESNTSGSTDSSSNLPVNQFLLLSVNTNFTASNQGAMPCTTSSKYEYQASSKAE